jgi:anti-sigma factor RsiW
MAAPVEDLPCNELVELVTDYVEGRLDRPTRERFDAHLMGCQGCRTYLEQMRQTIRSLGRLTEESIHPEARQRLLAAFRDWKRDSNAQT